MSKKIKKKVIKIKSKPKDGRRGTLKIKVKKKTIPKRNKNPKRKTLLA